MKPAGDIVAQEPWTRSRAPFAMLSVLLVAVFVLGGSSKDYVPGLIVLRPLAVITLAVGLYSLNRADWDRFRFPLGFMAATLGLIMLHLVPLPPFVWTAFPGRDLAVAAAEAAGIDQPWRPISLVPYRGWNAFYAMLVPAAVMVCAVQLDREQHRALVFLVLMGALASAFWAAVQSVSGYSPATFFYGLPRVEVPNGLFANRNHLAALLVSSVPLFALIGSRARGPRAALVILACAALAAFAVMIVLTTGSRAGMALCVLSLAASVLVWRARPLATSPDRRSGNKQPWVPFAFGAFGIAMLAVFAVLLSQTTGFERLLSAGSGEVEEYRFTVWRTIVEFAPSYFPLGSGIGSFVEVFKVHEPGEMLAQSYWNHAHNDWLEWAMEGGIAALALMALAVGGWATKAFGLLQNRHRGRIEFQLALAGAIILFVLGAWSLVDYPLRTPALASLAGLCAVWLALPEIGQRASGAAQVSGFAPRGGVGAGRS